MKSVFHSLLQSGIRPDDHPQKKRAILLANYTAIILATAILALYTIIPQNRNLSGAVECVVGILVFLVPILLNKFSLPNLSRMYLCWLPPVLLIWYMTSGMQEAEHVYASSYDGLRFYLLAFGCIPYLLFEPRNFVLLILGVFPGIVSVIFCDSILEFLGVAYSQKGVTDLGYMFTPIRSSVSYAIISSICLSLKTLIESGDRLNEKLIGEIQQKNQQLQEQSAQKLAQREREYLTLFEQASDSIFITKDTGEIIDFNSSATRLLGYSRDELLSRKITDIVDQQQLKVYPVNYNMAEGEYFLRERILRHKSGLPIETEASVKKIDGSRILSIVRDVSLRKKIEQELREAESKFRNLVERSLAGVYIIRDNTFTYVNPTFAEIFGYRQEELRNAPISIIVHPDDQSLVNENLRQRLLGEKESIRYELKGIKKNQQVVWVEAFGTRTLQEGKAAVIGTLIDITERKKLEEQQSFLASLVNSSEEAIISNGPDGRITSWNAGAEKLFGYSAQDVLGKPITFLIPSNRLSEDEYVQSQIDEGKSIDHHETQRVKKDGSLINVSLTISPIRNTHGKIIGASRIARDITDRKVAEAEKDRARYLLNERIKELHTLYSASQILQNEEKSVADVLHELVMILPPGWQYPDITAARITLGKDEFCTPNYFPVSLCQEATFQTPHGLTGVIQVIYLEDKPPEVEGPFLAEERDLINMLAEMIRLYLSRKNEKEALKKSEASLNATINNTTFFVWSINDRFELQHINQPFKKYIREQFGVDVQIGQTLNTLYQQGIQAEVFDQRWVEHYERALAGESFEIEEVHAGRSFKFSLNPIIDYQTVTGASIFSEDTTEDRKKERDLQLAQKQIGDLKLMALRAAMNPHFIFNTLNSIQYYIMENDQRKAVNYLSTFSKLIRAILNNSVNTRVNLAEEFQMLRHYVYLEQMRFENRFEFELNIPPDLDIENIEMPSMLIQPYVENAILHGIVNRNREGGKLKIDVQETSGGLLFEIEDNGIGRKAAGQIKKKSKQGYQSYGTTLTEERLKLINAQRNVALEIIDLEEGGVASGTKVKIWVSE
ncbi:MAG TPA: PAS domain S-box protein [Ohtaekwangia sp.]